MSSALAFSSPLPANAAPGDLDATFGTGGVAPVPTSTRELRVALNGPLRMADGKLVFYGTTTPRRNDATAQGLVQRYMPDGSPDAGFGTNARVLLNDIGDIGDGALAVQSTGHLIAVANTGATSIARRIDSSGTIDGSWGSSFTGLGPLTAVQSAVADAQDRVLVFGYRFNSSPGSFPIAVVGARLAADTGAIEATFEDTTTATYLSALAVDAIGTPIVATSSKLTWFSAPPVTQPLVGFNGVDRLAVDGAGRVLVGGHERVNGRTDARVQRFAAQVLDATFGDAGTFDGDFELLDTVSSITTDTSNRVVLTVNSATGAPNAQHHSRVVRLTSAGTLDASFDQDGARTITWQGWAFESDVSLHGVFVDGANRVVVGGDVSAFVALGESGPGLLLGRFDTSGAPDLSFGSSGVNVSFTATVAPVPLRPIAMVTAPNATYVLTPATFYGTGFRVVRLNEQGLLDSTYGGTDGANVGLDIRPFGIDLDSQGRIVLLGVASARGWLVARLTTSGVLDQSFAIGGLSVATSEVEMPTGFALDALDRISVVTARFSTNAQLRRFTSSGFPDTSLAPGGTVDLAGLFVNVGGRANESMAFQADGGFTVATSVSRLRRYRADGTLDPSFQHDSILAERFAVDTQGRPVTMVSGGLPTAASVARYTAAGIPDATFPTIALPPVNLATSQPISITSDAQDRVLVAYTDAATGSVGLRLYRISANGGLDASFGSAGMVFEPASSDYWNVMVLADGASRPLVLGWILTPGDAVLRRFESGTSAPADTINPAIVITSPAEGAIYQAGSTVAASYTCSDDVAIAGCVGTSAVGSPIDTATPGSKSFVVAAVDQAGNSTTTTVTYSVVGTAPPPPSSAPTEYQPLTPHRLLDTRVPVGVPSAVRVQPGGQIDLSVLDRAGVPQSGVGAVALNITVTNVDAAGYLTVWPSGDTRPNASSLNFPAGATVANTVIAKVGASGRVSLWNSDDDRGYGAIDVIADVVGWYPASSSFTALAPKRLMDTRVPIGLPTAQRLEAGATTSLRLTGSGDIPASGVGAVALNVTVVAPAAAGYITVWPKGEDRPNASSVNFSRGTTVANLVIAKVGADGSVTLWNSDDSSAMGSVDVLVDVVGWFAAGASYTAVTPTRALDTRIPIGVAAAGPLNAGSTIELATAGIGAPPGATAVVLNLTVTGGSTGGYLTVWPTGEPRPTASSINFATGQTVANLVIAKIGPAGSVSIWNSNDETTGSVHVLADVVGGF